MEYFLEKSNEKQSNQKGLRFWPKACPKHGSTQEVWGKPHHIHSKPQIHKKRLEFVANYYKTQFDDDICVKNEFWII